MIIKVLNYCFLALFALGSPHLWAESPEVIQAEASPTDEYFPYKTRPFKDSPEALAQYPRAILDNLDKLAHVNPQIVPWSFKGIPAGNKDSFKLQDIIADKIVDEESGKTYNVMYHGTTSDLLNVFKEGAKAIRFDVATHVVLGMGFYLTASINEAKGYACERLKQRRSSTKDLKAIILVVGVEEQDVIQGKTSPQAQLSDDKTGEPLDKEIYFKRKTDPKNQTDNRYNQFSFFKNVASYLKIFKIVILPLGFGRTNWVQDLDGQAEEPKALYKLSPAAFTCQ